MDDRLTRTTGITSEHAARSVREQANHENPALAGLRRAVQVRSDAQPWHGKADACGYLVNRDVRVVAVERSPRRALAANAQGLQIIDGRLLPADDELAERWKTRVNQVVTTGQGHLFPLGKLAADGCVVLRPGPRPGTVHVRLRRPTVLDDETIASVVRLAGMSTRESQVFAMLLAGMPPKQISGELRTTLSTVRSQVKSVLAKTGYGGMRELVAAMACMPSVAGPAAQEIFDETFRPTGN
ncbi:MAG: LuxR C-terminal-related transcriptional regulator [Burkholderiaceae bacterium]